LFRKNKVSKYLLYLIGKRLLVVIGILIALEIKNRNEDRIKRSEMSNIYISIIDELETDSKISDEIMPDFKWNFNILIKL